MSWTCCHMFGPQKGPVDLVRSNTSVFDIDVGLLRRLRFWEVIPQAVTPRRPKASGKDE